MGKVVSIADILGLSEEEQGEWCLLSICTSGHPTYSCPVCLGERVRITTPGGTLPPSCPCCSRPLSTPRVGTHAKLLLTRGGHTNLIIGQ